MNIQDEVIKIHGKYGVTEKANYEIQKLCETYADEYHKAELEKELTDENREYPTPQKDGLETVYKDGTKIIGGWSTRLEKWQELNLHRIRKNH